LRPALHLEEPAAREPGSGGWGWPGSRKSAMAMLDARCWQTTSRLYCVTKCWQC